MEQEKAVCFTHLAGRVYLAVNPAPGTPLIADAQAALDLIATARYECGCEGLVLRREDLAAEFFDLASGLAGAVLQKFVNYNMRVAIVGDFSGYTSKSLRDFIRESNRGSAVNFLADPAEAAARLAE